MKYMYLTAEEVNICLNFSKKAAKNTQKVEFGQSDSKVRSNEEIARDIFMGKLGEIAFKKYLEKYDIKTSVDFVDYGPGKWDKEDIFYNTKSGKWKIDVKCTKMQSKWFLIEWNKLQFREHDKELPHFFVLTRITKNIQELTDLQRNGLDIEITGYVNLHRLRPGYNKTVVLRKGTQLPGANSPKLLQADNLGIRIEDLSTDWEHLVNIIKDETPFDTSFYHAPSETTAEFLSRMQPLEPLQQSDNKINIPAKYSLLLSGHNAEKITLDALEEYMGAGIKCLIFLKNPSAQTLKNKFQKKYGRTCFRIHIPIPDQILPNLCIIDGQMSNEQQKQASILGSIPYNTEDGLDFNWEQYQIEHAPLDDAMIIRASAGTGKTTVMIDRILFLLAMSNDITLKDIGMITFTNAAAGHMRHKIQERLGMLYLDTHQNRYLHCMEDLNEMHIQTIDSFFKEILSEEGSWLGYGRTASVRGFIKEKKAVLEEVLDEILRNSGATDYIDNFKLTRNEYINFAYYFWEKFNSRGFFGPDIENMDFGKMTKFPKYAIINTTLKNLIVEAEKRYEIIKQQTNAFSLSDIKAEFSRLSDTGCHKLRLTNFRILFIDEFQDTDNAQIANIVWLRKILNCKLFVVGDVKQSIYRFRGAEENAFDELKNRLYKSGVPVNNIIDKILRKNYRTCSNVLSKLDIAFLKLGEAPNYDLPYDKNASVQACIKSEGSITRKTISKNEIFNILCNLLKDCLAKNRKTAVLCRTNKQVAQVATLCHQENIPCLLRHSGGFYKCKAVQDFVSLIRALIYPNDVRLLYNFLITPYSNYLPDAKYLERQAGDEKLQFEYLKSIFYKDGWKYWLDMISHKPAFILLREIVMSINPVERFRQRLIQERAVINKNRYDDIQLDVSVYELNLNKIFQLLYEHFKGEFASILEIYDFLELKIQTDSDEELLYPDPEDVGNSVIEAMTVHKAKGLEFETVILPFTLDPFMQNENYNKYNALYTETSDLHRVGWALHHRSELIYNDYYSEMKKNESKAARREASRLLYVAATRCRRDLIFFLEKAPISYSNWTGLMNSWQEVGKF